MAICAPISYNDATFRAAYPAFASQPTYPTPTLQLYFCEAQSFVQNNQYNGMEGCATQMALYLLTAHFAQLATNIMNGNTTPGVETQATIDKVSITMMQPPLKTAWQWWLGQTQYGAQFLALMQAKSVGGFYSAGGPGRAGFGFR